jgi:hypothetical protein
MIYFKVFFIACIIFQSCSENKSASVNNNHKVESNFYINKFNGNLVLNSCINDTIPCSLIFDTGASGLLIVKSSVSDKFYQGESSVKDSLVGGFDDAFYYSDNIKEQTKVHAGNKDIEFKSFKRVPDNSALGEIISRSNADGIISVQDSIKSLKLEFSSKRILFNTDNDIIDADIVLQLTKKGKNYIIKQFPFIFKLGDATIMAKEDLMMDTGYRGDISCKNISLDNVFENAILTLSKKKIRMSSKDYLLITDTLHIKRDIWIEYNNPLKNYYYVLKTSLLLVGVEFLKTFDIYMDFQKDSIWLKKINYESILDGSDSDKIDDPIIAGRYNSVNKQYIVMYLKSKSPYTTAGIMPGDIICDINNINFMLIRDSIRNKTVRYPLIFNILRDGKSIALYLPDGCDLR